MGGSSGGNGSKTGSARKRRESIYRNKITWADINSAADLPF